MTSRIYKRPSKTGLSWSYCIDLGKDSAGARQRETKHGFETKREANEVAQARIEALKVELSTPQQVGVLQTLGGFINDVWFPMYAGRKCSPKTLERYHQLALYLSPEIRDSVLVKVDTLSLDREAIRLSDGGGIKGGKLAPKTIRHIFGVIKTALNQAVVLKLINVNPAALCTLPTIEPRKSKALDLHTSQELLDTLKDHWLYPIVFFAAATGCRRGEILALRWEDLDLVSHNATIRRSLEQTKAGLRIKKPKGGKERDCPLPASLIAVLVQHRDERLAGYKQAFGSDYCTEFGELVFPAPHGGFLKPDTITAETCARFTKAGYNGFGLHSLRHSHGSQLIAAGVPIPTVSKRLGHANPEITARVYAHSFEKQEREAADVWERLLNENGRKSSGQQMATNLPQVVGVMAALTGFEPVFKP